MATVQRSITFPPIRLKKIDEYIVYVAKYRPSPHQLKSAGLDIGRGRGDITRFLERVGVVASGDVVELTEVGKLLVSIRESIGVAVYHALFYQRVPQYRLLIDVVKDGVGEFSHIYTEVNRRIAVISPTAWLNKVAFRTLLQIAQDLETVRKMGNAYTYVGDPVERAVLQYFTNSAVKVGADYYTSLDRVLFKECGKLGPSGLYKVDVMCVIEKIYTSFMP